MAPTPGPRVLSEHHAVLPLAPAVVLQDLMRVPTGAVSGDELPLVPGIVPGRTVHLSGGPTTFSATMGEVSLTLEINEAEGWVQARGQWWWCGRFQVTDHPSGSLIIQRTYNLASGPVARLVPFTVGRGHAAQGRQALRRLIAELGRRHDCEGRLLD